MNKLWEEIRKMFNTECAAIWYDDMPQNHCRDSFEELTKEEIECEIADYVYERDHGIYTIVDCADDEYFEAIDEILVVLNKRLEKLK